MNLTLSQPFPMAASIPDLVALWSEEVTPTSDTTGRRYPGKRNTATGKTVVDPIDWAGWMLAKADDDFAQRVLRGMSIHSKGRVKDAMKSWRERGIQPSRRGHNLTADNAA
ncbi:hypothetical protein [Ruegeria sp. HKCCA5491]|uniref:hypothetical protein n=1 Tax=Ruegeria sp. HKCCA5491 TaxID=2682986 RepID=UPI001489DDA6|nr:hypothetical protein [Ruegeria sp. HKCCA5491]